MDFLEFSGITGSF